MAATRPRVLFASRDTGSMQAVLPVIEALRGAGSGLNPHVICTAVSLPVLQRRAIDAELFDQHAFDLGPMDCIDALLDRTKPALVVSGSSPARGASPETPEQFLILAAAARGVPVLAVLDYWGMYRERFAGPDGRLDLSLVPPRLCVLDQLCRDDLVAFGVPPERLVVTHNPWLDRLGRLVAGTTARPPSSTTGRTVLFVSQPLAESRKVRAWPFDQHTMLSGLTRALELSASGQQDRVMVWAHPDEAADRWTGIDRFEKSRVKVALQPQRGIGVLDMADLVVTSHSTLVYEALHLGVPCIAFRPGGEQLEKLITERAGICPTITNEDALADYLSKLDFPSERRRLAALKDKLLAKQVFFNDGQATARVAREVRAMLGTPDGEAQ